MLVIAKFEGFFCASSFQMSFYSVICGSFRPRGAASRAVGNLVTEAHDGIVASLSAAQVIGASVSSVTYRC